MEIKKRQRCKVSVAVGLMSNQYQFSSAQPDTSSIQPHTMSNIYQQKAVETNFTSIYYHNASSIRGKAKSFLLGLLDNDYDIVIICETWLTNRYYSEEYFPATYVVHRKDRHNFDTNLKGGGILIAMKCALSNELLACHSRLDVMAVRINIAKPSLLIVAVYIPCGSNLELYIEIINFIDYSVLPLLRDGEQLMLIGDFNLPDLFWVDDGMFSSTNDERAVAVLEYFSSIGTKQINRVSNRRGKFLDLVFSTNDLYAEISSCADFTGCVSIHHSPISITIFQERCIKTSVSNNYFKFDFRRIDYTSLNDFLLNSDWSFLGHELNLNDIVLRFNECLNAGIVKHAPLVRNTRQFREPWYNAKLVRLEKCRNKLHSLYRLHGIQYYSAFKSARKEFKVLNWFLYNNYILKIEDNLNSNPKEFWNFINKKRKVAGMPSTMSYQNFSASEPYDISNLFASFFESAYNPSLSSDGIHFSAIEYYQFNQWSFMEEEVLEYLSRLDINKGAGPDGIPPILLRNCAESLVMPLTFIFNESLRIGVFPDPWKLSYIHPIFKSGKRSQIENYRGIAMLSAIPKLFEAMVQKYLFFHLKNIISTKQHGFFPGRSTVTNLVSFCGHLYNKIEQRQQVDVIYTDFSKAFDKIDHSILINKLENLNCQHIPIKWLHSYLSDRRQFVKIQDSSSRLIHVTSGVPQGSHIGPLLFSIYVNDVVDCFDVAHCLLYADDIKIMGSIKNLTDCMMFQNDLDSFCSWSANNKLFLNAHKCKVQSFFRINSPMFHQYYLGDTAVDRVEIVSDLGIIFTSDLTFGRHIDSIIAKAYVMLGFIKRNCKDFCDPLTLRSLYVAFVRSILEYASQVWSPFYQNHSNRIESIQKQFIIYALRQLPSQQILDYVLPPYRDRCNLLRLDRLEHRRDVASAIFIYNMLNDHIDCPEILSRFKVYAPQRRMRPRDGFLQIDSVSTNYGLAEPVLSMSRVFNSVYKLFDFNLSRNSFRSELFKFFKSRETS